MLSLSAFRDQDGGGGKRGRESRKVGNEGHWEDGQPLPGWEGQGRIVVYR